MGSRIREGMPSNPEERRAWCEWCAAVQALACLVTLTAAIPPWAQEKQADLSSESG